MKAARLHKLNTPLRMEEVPLPILQPGGVLVRVLAAHIPSFTHGVLSGALGYALPPLPYTPGGAAVGVVEAVAENVFDFEAGQLVFCDPYLYSHHNQGKADSILIAWTGLSEHSPRLQTLWKDGTFAQQVLWPAECLTVLEQHHSYRPEQWAALAYLCISYGGLLKGEVKAGQTLVVNGATGGLGAGAVLVALAMGVSKIVAVGRNASVLESIKGLDPRRVVTVSSAGAYEDYAGGIRQAAGGADVMVDFLGGATTSDPTLACLRALRPEGIGVLMGSVLTDLPLPYTEIMLAQLQLRGAFMYPRTAPRDLMRLINAGLLDLAKVQIDSFPLAAINQAIGQAAALKGLHYAMLTPAA